MKNDRKKEHKKVVTYMRKLNKQVMTDEYLGLNRFRMDLFAEKWNRYDDGSGGQLTIYVKMTDKETNNKAFFIVNNYDYKRKMPEYMNDFLIRCSSGQAGSWPHLHYVAYDVHTIIPYAGSKRNSEKYEDGIITKYNYTKCTQNAI